MDLAHLIKASAPGIVQGLTEFLPISWRAGRRKSTQTGRMIEAMH